jgi:hypothetical protein
MNSKSNKSFKTPSYAKILMYRVIHKEVMEEVNNIIKDGMTRKSLNRDDNGLVCGIQERKKYYSPLEWCFGSGFKTIQLQPVNCALCGGYIQTYFRFSHDKFRMIKYIYCDDLIHHNRQNRIDDILRIKELLLLYQKTRHKPYLYRASLHATISENRILDQFSRILSEYIGLG